MSNKMIKIILAIMIVVAMVAGWMGGLSIERDRDDFVQKCEAQGGVMVSLDGRYTCFSKSAVIPIWEK